MGRLAALAVALIVLVPFANWAQQVPTSDKPAAGPEAVSVAAPSPVMRLLPDTLAGQKATSDPRQVGRDNIVEFVAERAPIYQEYLVVSAASREYAGARVEVYETRNQFAALGLFEFNSGAGQTRNRELEVGWRGAQVDRELIFWKGNFFVRVFGFPQTSGRHEILARAVANAIVPGGPTETRSPLFDSLPSTVAGAAQVPGSQRYFLGPESLNTFIEHGREMFGFLGDTEAVTADYTAVEGGNAGASQALNSNQTKGKSNSAVPAPAASPLKLVIVECHTPEFATDELARITNYVSSLPETEQHRIVFKRTGNYIIAAMNVGNREVAEGLVNSVQYPYTVKWLRNPLWPTNDPFRTQKAAEMLLSTFGLLGLILLTVLLGGTIFGASVFLKRRKRQREIFSDAGGMLRLDIEPFLLALPPKRDE
jgi:hypothetical protein